MDYFRSLIIFILFYTVKCINIYHSRKSATLTCSLPVLQNADKLVLSKNNSNNSYIVEVPLTTDNLYYCKDNSSKSIFRNYTFIIDKAKAKHEGYFSCIFYLDDNETYRHTIQTVVFPKVETYWYNKDKHVCYICNITRPLNKDKLKVYMITGGVNITNRFLREFNSTHKNLIVGNCADTSYQYWATTSVCVVSYYNHSIEYNISYVDNNGGSGEEYFKMKNKYRNSQLFFNQYVFY